MHFPAYILLTATLVGVPTLQAMPVISEFMAVNDTVLNDEDGENSDWIEIRNDGTSDINLSGWHLTDDAGLLSKWTFPSHLLNPGERVVVFASQKDRRTAGLELHTNFRLSKDGEFLALVMPDGTNTTTTFAPVYPPQYVDISYGSSVPSAEQTLVLEGSPAKARVPDSAYNSAVGSTWRNNDPSFNETGWSAGLLGVGYERSNGYQSDIGLDMEADMYLNNGTVYIRIPFPAIANPGHVVELTLRMKYDDGFVAFLNGVPVAAANAPGSLVWNSIATSSHGDNLAQIFVDYDITAFSSNLSTNANILAIHGLNMATNSSDMLILPELILRRSETNTSTSTGFLAAPTPGTSNPGVVYDGVIEDTHFSIGRGFYTNVFQETITCTTAGATLVHTLDGSVPTLSNGVVTPPPNATTAPTGTVSITNTTTLRVQAFKDGFIPTNIDTSTYIFPHLVVLQTGAGYPLPPHPDKSNWDYEMDPEIVNDPRFPNVAADLLTLPSLSLVMDRDALWGTGGVYSNPDGYGFDYEAACSVEYLRPDGGPGFQEDGGYRLQGSGSRRTSRPFSKKSMRIIFRKMYGAGKLDFPLFGERGAQQLDNIVLRGNYFDSWTVHIDGSAEGIARKNAMVLRDEYGRKTLQDMGATPVVQGGWAHIYLNGMYWGVYNLHERPDENFAADRFGGDKGDYDVIKTGLEVVKGDRVAWDQLMTTINGDITNSAVYASVRQQLDVEAFVEYLLMNFYGSNNDWPHNNWYVMRNRTANAPFTFIAWDVEHYIFQRNDFGPINTSSANSPGIVWARLQQNPEFLLYFADRVHKHMFNDGALTPDKCAARFMGIVDTVLAGMNGEAARWGDCYDDYYNITNNPPYNTADHYNTVVMDKMNNYFPIRTSVVLNNLRNSGYYPATAAPEFFQHGGQVPVDYPLIISNPGGIGTIYFTTDGMDPRLNGGAVNPSATNGSTLTISSPTSVKARILNNGEWSALTEAVFVPAVDPLPGDLVVSELHYHPLPPTPSELLAGFLDEDDFEYLEVLNVSTSSIDLTGTHLEGAVSLDFGTLPDPADRLLPPGGSLLLAGNTNAIVERYGSNVYMTAEYAGKLNNGGETFRMMLGITSLINFTYDDATPWPESPDGHGPALVLRNPYGLPDHSDPLAWRPSAYFGGTPGSDGPVEPTYPASPTGDTNTNGVIDVVDYAVNQTLYWSIPPSSGTGPVARVSFAKILLADQLRASVALSTNLTHWTNLPDDNFLNEVHHNDGTATYSFHLGDLTATNDTLYLKLLLSE